MAIVSVREVESYDQELLDRAVEAHFKALSVEDDIRPGMRVVLKPNLLAARKPEHAVTTHPALVRAVARWFRERGVERVVLADSPGGPFAGASLDAVYAASGMGALADVLELSRDVGSREVPAAPGSTQARFPIISAVLDADYVVNLPKMKTHGMTTVSLGVKNLFGVVPGLIKPRLHYQNPSIEGFSNMLVSLCETVKPDLTVLDAVLGMEGNGPGGGTPRHVGLILASRDIYAQDHYAASLMGIDPADVQMLRIARERGLYDPDEIEILGDGARPFDPPFTLPDTKRLDFLSAIPGFVRRPLSALMDRLVRPVPVVAQGRCVGCGKCAESCPRHIIRIEGQKAVIARRNCISCFCCQEMCPVKAIEVEKKLRIG